VVVVAALVATLQAEAVDVSIAIAAGARAVRAREGVRRGKITRKAPHVTLQ
jgi:hypothetical protein